MFRSDSDMQQMGDSSAQNDAVSYPSMNIVTEFQKSSTNEN